MQLPDATFWWVVQEATVRTGHGTTDWFQIGKRVCQGCILSLVEAILDAHGTNFQDHWLA